MLLFHLARSGNYRTKSVTVMDFPQEKARRESFPREERDWSGNVKITSHLPRRVKSNPNEAKEMGQCVLREKFTSLYIESLFICPHSSSCAALNIIVRI